VRHLQPWQCPETSKHGKHWVQAAVNLLLLQHSVCCITKLSKLSGLKGI
jgi:hypothetical protein